MFCLGQNFKGGCGKRLDVHWRTTYSSYFYTQRSTTRLLHPETLNINLLLPNLTKYMNRWLWYLVDRIWQITWSSNYCNVWHPRTHNLATTNMIDPVSNKFNFLKVLEPFQIKSCLLHPVLCTNPGVHLGRPSTRMSKWYYPYLSWLLWGVI